MCESDEYNTENGVVRWYSGGALGCLPPCDGAITFALPKRPVDRTKAALVPPTPPLAIGPVGQLTLHCLSENIASG